MDGHEGKIPFRGNETWYRVVGEGEEPGKTPVLCLHGGPGASWHHMEPYEELAEGRRVVFYDRLGCGNSAVNQPHDTSMWTYDLYVEEVTAVRDASASNEYTSSVIRGAGCSACCTRSRSRPGSRA